MRSARPKPLHLLCGRAMLLLRPRRPRATARPTGPSSWSATAPSGSPRSCTEASPDLRPRLRRAARPAGHRRRRRGRPHRLPRRRRPRRRRRARPARRHAAAAARDRRRPRPGAPASGRRLHGPHRRARRPDRLRPRRPAARTARVARIVEQRDATAEELAIAEVNTSIYCFRRSAARPRAAPRRPRQRPGRVLPDRRRRGARTTPATRSVTVVAADPARDRTASTTGSSWPRPRPSCAAARTSAGCGRASPWSIPTHTYIDATVELAPDVTLFPGDDPPGRNGRRRRRRDRPRHPPGRLRGRRTNARSTTPSGRDAEIGDGRRRRALRRARAGQSGPAGDPYRAVLHCDWRRARKARHGAGHQEDAAALLRDRPPGAGRRRSPSHLGVALGEPNLRRFANGEIHCRFGESVRGADVFIIQSHAQSTAGRSTTRSWSS